MKASWKARTAALAMAAAIMASYSLPVYAAGMENAEPTAAVQTEPNDADPAEQVSGDTTTATEKESPAADGSADTSEETPAPAEDAVPPLAPIEGTPAEDKPKETVPAEESPAEEEKVTAPAEDEPTETVTAEKSPVEKEKVIAPVEEDTSEQELSVARISAVQAASAGAAVSALWHDDFSDTVTATNANVQKAWKNGIVPKNWNSIWIANAPADYSKTYWEVVQDAAYTGGKAMHLHSEDAGARLVIASAAKGLDYSKEYVLRMRVKTKDLTKLQVRTQIADNGNIFLTAVNVPGGTTSDWTTVEMPLRDMQKVYDAFVAPADNPKSNNKGNLKIEMFSKAGTTGDVWIDTIDIVSKEDNEASQGKTLWSMNFDKSTTASDVTGGAAKYFVDGLDPKDFTGSWVPAAPDVNKFQLKLDDTTKVSGQYSLYAKSTYPDYDKTGTSNSQRVQISANTGYPTDADYTQTYVLRAKVKMTDAGRTVAGSAGTAGATLRIDIKGTSFTSERILGTGGWQTISLRLTPEDLQSKGATSGQLKPSIMYEHFCGEIWVDDMELIALPYTLTIQEGDITLQQGESKKLTTNAHATDRQCLDLHGVTITGLTLDNLKKADDPSPFPALTQVEVWGTSL